MATAVASQSLLQVAVRRRWYIPVFLWTTFAFFLNYFQEQVFLVHNGMPDDITRTQHSLPLNLYGKAAWDTGAYGGIAERGYQPGTAHEAFFPGYPLCIRFLNTLTHDIGKSGMYISMACGFAAALLFWQWLHLKGFTVRQASLAMALFLVYPYGFVMYGVVYADAMLVACVMAALVAIEKRAYVLAGLAGAAATFTRPNSLALIIGLVVIALEQTGVVTLRLPERSFTIKPRAIVSKMRMAFRSLQIDLARWQWRAAAVLLSLCGVGAYSVWLTIKHGDPLYFWTVQAQYGRLPMTSPHMWLKTSLYYGYGIFWNAPGWELLDLAWCFAAFVLAALALPSLGRKFGWGYAVFTFGILVIIWTGTSWFSPGRYLLPVVPILIALFVPWLMRHRLVAILFGTVSAVWCFTLAAGFAGLFGVAW